MLDDDAIARTCHDANRALQIALGEEPNQPWPDAATWQRDSAIEGVQHARDGATPEQLHESWCDAKRRDGWTFGEIKDPIGKTHPCLVPYDMLPREQQVKDALFGAIVGALTT